MIIYLAGAGVQPENEERILFYEKENWGILISFKDVRSKDGKGNKRFKNIKKRKNENTKK